MGTTDACTWPEGRHTLTEFFILRASRRDVAATSRPALSWKSRRSKLRLDHDFLCDGPKLRGLPLPDTIVRGAHASKIAKRGAASAVMNDEREDYDARPDSSGDRSQPRNRQGNRA